LRSSGKQDSFSIRSEGDLEVAILHENQVACTDIIDPDLYIVAGKPPNQNIAFHNDACFRLFVIHVAEVFAEGRKTLTIGVERHNFSLFSGALWLCKRHPRETKESGLGAACRQLDDWLQETKPFSFWCGSLGTEFELEMPRKALLKYGANITKHNILRLNSLLSNLQGLCKRNGFDMSETELLQVFEPFTNEIYNRLKYHSTYLVEMLYDYFAAMNRLIIRRYEANPTNRVVQMTFPEGITSDAYKDLYGDVLVFLRFRKDRLKECRPHTAWYHKMRY